MSNLLPEVLRRDPSFACCSRASCCRFSAGRHAHREGAGIEEKGGAWPCDGDQQSDPIVTAIGVTIFFTLWEVSLQEHVPAQALSRVSSWDYLASSAVMPVGTAVAGPLVTLLGTRARLLGMSALGVAAAVAFLAVPSVRALPRGAQPVAG